MNKVFIENDLDLDSAVGYSQYIYNFKKLVTIIGEKHKNYFKCKNNSITIAEYCKNSIENSNCIVMLEYNNNINPEYIGSKNIRQIYKLLKENNMEKYINAIDIRPEFLTSKQQNTLYSSDIYDYTNEELYKNYIIPYNKYIKKYNINSEFINRNLTVEQLRELWSKIVDDNILNMIKNIENVDEIIILIGNKHYKNLKNMFEKDDSFVLINEKSGDKYNCINVKIYNSLTIS